MRLLLIANIEALTVTPRGATVIERALASDFDVDLARTTHAGHATELARGAEKFDLVVAMGGDGTVNEVANGLAGSGVPLGIIPAGGGNVFARSLGIPRDPIDATALLLSRAHRPPRAVTLGRAAGRYFLFTCGMGLDAAIVRRLERRRMLRHAVGQASYVWAGLTTFFFAFDRRTPNLTVRWGPELQDRREGLFFGAVQNANPFTYLGPLPLRLSPSASLERGLDLVASGKASLWSVLRLVAGSLGRGRHVRREHVLHLRDEPAIELTSEVPMPVQMDGEYVGRHRRLLLESVDGALSVVC